MGRSAPAIGGTGVKALSEPCRTTIDQFSSSSPWGHHYRFPRTPGGGSLSSWSNEAITYGGLVDDQRWPGGISLQLLTKAAHRNRSEEHTSELQSLMRNSYAVFCLQKKNNTSTILYIYVTITQQLHILT